MCTRLKILNCGYIDRDEKQILQEVQLVVLDTANQNKYIIVCELVNRDEDCYEIRILEYNHRVILDTCHMDSSGGIFRDDDFTYNEFNRDFGSAVIELIRDYFIVPF